MKIKPTSSTKKYILISILAAVLIGAGAYAYYVYSQNTSSPSSPNTTNYQPATNDQQKAGEDTKKQTVDSDTSKGNQSDNGSTPTKDTIAVSITSAIQNGTAVNIRSLIETVTSSGSCTLKLSKGSNVVTKTSGIQALATSSTCKGFDVPTSEMTKGTWKATLAVTIDGKTGSATKAITVQ